MTKIVLIVLWFIPGNPAALEGGPLRMFDTVADCCEAIGEMAEASKFNNSLMCVEIDRAKSLTVIEGVHCVG